MVHRIPAGYAWTRLWSMALDGWVPLDRLDADLSVAATRAAAKAFPPPGIKVTVARGRWIERAVRECCRLAGKPTLDVCVVIAGSPPDNGKVFLLGRRTT